MNAPNDLPGDSGFRDSVNTTSGARSALQFAVGSPLSLVSLLLHSVNSEAAVHSGQTAVRHLRGLDFPLGPQVLP